MSHRDYAQSLFPGRDLDLVDIGSDMRAAVIHATETLLEMSGAQLQAIETIASLRLSDPCDRLQHELEDIRDPVTAAHLQGQKHGIDGLTKDISPGGLKHIRDWLKQDNPEE